MLSEAFRRIETWKRYMQFMNVHVRYMQYSICYVLLIRYYEQYSSYNVIQAKFFSSLDVLLRHMHLKPDVSTCRIQKS